jgi:predicted transcriptional regulator
MAPQLSSRIEELARLGENPEVFRALSNELRRLLLGLIYTDGPMYQSDIARHVEVKSNLLAYHLEILRKANLVERKYAERSGQNFSLYSITEQGKKFLELIGAKAKLESMKKKSGAPVMLEGHERRIGKNEKDLKWWNRTAKDIKNGKRQHL